MDTPSTDTTLLGAQQDTTQAAGGNSDTGVTDASGAQTATDTQAAAGDQQATGQGTDGAKTDEGTKDGDKPTGAPEQYEAFTMPEGVELDADLLGEFTPTLKELNLSQEAAQKVIDFAPKLIEKTVAQTQTAMLDKLGLADFPTWAEAAKTDKEFGGEKFAENLAIAVKARDAFGTPELRALLNKTGIGNHPEVVRFFYRAGKQISEDSFVPGGKTQTVNPANALYDKSNMNP